MALCRQRLLAVYDDAAVGSATRRLLRADGHEFGTCTTHTNTVDLGPLLAGPGKVPANTVVRLPTPNHSRIIRGADFDRVWWQVVVDVVTDRSVWPNVDGT